MELFNDPMSTSSEHGLLSNLPGHLSQLLQPLREANQQSLHSEIANSFHMSYVSPLAHILEDALAALCLGKNVLLKGPTGSGKTVLAQTLSGLLALPMQSINCSVDLDMEALIGFKTLSYTSGEAEIQYVPGPVVTTMQSGHLLYIDEINMARPDTLPILNGILDYRRKLTNPLTTEVISAKSSFRVIAAMNEGYVGTTLLNEAVKNRFVVVEVPYLQGKMLRALLQTRTRLKDGETLNRMVALSSDYVAQVGLGQLPDEVASIRALCDACDLASVMPPLRAIEHAITSKLTDVREQQLTRHLAETYFPASNE